MPYVTKNFRQELEPLIDALSQKVLEINSNNPKQTRDGLLNFAVTEILNQTFPNAKYTDFNELIGFLECCKLEYYRKKIAPYEDLKESENGAVRQFDNGNKSGY
ncbi:hypothetical protein GW796_07155 [archaeon]|nr:hypothetical protein [archaeon]